MAARHPVPDRETLARATLTFCLDGADALMYALIKGAGSAASALELLVDARADGVGRDGTGSAMNRLDRTFALGLARWGRRVNARGMGVFHRSLAGWLSRLDGLPTPDWEHLGDWFTMGGRQWIIAPHSPYWPAQLQDLSTRSDWAAPLCLWGLGDAAALVSCDRPLAVVGSRDATEYGCAVAREIAARVAADGHLVVSGGAMGVDAAAHWGALSAGRDGNPDAGRTVAVFAGGLNHIGPQRNHRLFDAIVAHGGALVSELCPGTIPEGRRFLLRNRIIAALASEIVVAQARPRSGALNTAGWGCDLNRAVIAVPGGIDQPYNAGCNRLIADAKAILLTSPDEIADLMHASHTPCVPCAPDLDDGESEDATTGPSTAESDGTTGAETTGTADAGAARARTDPGRAVVVSAIRSCARRGSPAAPDALLDRCNALDPSHPLTMPRLLALLGDMESAGVIRADGGALALVTATGHRASGSVDGSGDGSRTRLDHDALAPTAGSSAGAVSDVVSGAVSDTAPDQDTDGTARDATPPNGSG